jgi:hypothetical protein
VRRVEGDPYRIGRIVLFDYGLDWSFVVLSLTEVQGLALDVCDFFDIVEHALIGHSKLLSVLHGLLAAGQDVFEHFGPQRGDVLELWGQLAVAGNDGSLQFCRQSLLFDGLVLVAGGDDVHPLLQYAAEVCG